MFMPHLNFPNSQFIFKPGTIDFSEFSGQVAVVQRQVGERNKNALYMLKEAGYKLVYDLDDDVWNLPQGNPLKKAFEHVAEDFDPCVSLCDVVTCSTRGLELAIKGKLGYLNKPIVVVPNAIDMNLYCDSTVQKDDGMVVIGWQGSSTHFVDIREAWESLPDVVLEHENVRMEFVGNTPPPKRLLAHERVRIRGWVQVGGFPARMATWAWDIALAPLEDVRFNRSKSAIKLLEHSVQKCPVLCSDVQPYRDFCRLGGKDLEWLLCSFASQWKPKLKRLVEDKAWREHLGQLAYDVTDRFYNAKTVVHNWKRACRMALEN
jgi:hypothetical protein